MDIKLNKLFYNTDYQISEEEFIRLIHLDNLDRQITETPSLVENFEKQLDLALSEAYENPPGSEKSHLFLQRILYRINRLKLFWYDDLENYVNENSQFLFSLRNRIETAWQGWEAKHLDIEPLKKLEVNLALRHRVKEDLDPEPSREALFFRKEITETGYRRLLAITSLDGLVEASQLSRVLGGASNEVQSMLTRILLEEYGSGKLARKHSSFFAVMLEEFGMETQPEAYFDLVPWEVLANINHSFLLCERKRNFLRYVGSLLYTEVSVPAAFKNYRDASRRLGLSQKGTGYWDLHIKEDQRHGRWMLRDVALPLIERYEESAWEIVWGYDRQRFLSTRAGKAIVQSVRRAEIV
ncbi:MAG: iron-containing redox enzyme family protein [Nitrospinae bacterium]|nr:iron-containing redox enzyme family protein [Nitrospinota bacterium]